jgi:signal transduction histidine kinase
VTYRNDGANYVDGKEHARDQLNKLTQTLDVLSALVREENRNKCPLNVLSVLEDVTITLSLSELRPDFQLNIEVPDNYQVVANETLLYLLFRNLIENAHHQGGDNTLTISLEQQSLRFSNQNNNTGVATKPDSAAAPLGIGQGLFLARRIVEFHHGELTVTASAGDSDNDFSVYISLPPQPNAQALR